MGAFKPDGDQVLIHVPDELGRRVLHAALHVGTEGERLVLDLESPLELEVDQDLFLFYEMKRKFMQHPARVIEFRPPSGVTLEPTADPVLAESRQSYRCSTVVEDIHANVGSESSCRVMDVSQTGLAVICKTAYSPGTKVDLTLAYEGRELAGTVVVQSLQGQPDGSTRYGLRVVAGPLFGQIANVAMSVQRNQLRRRSGSC